MQVENKGKEEITKEEIERLINKHDIDINISSNNFNTSSELCFVDIDEYIEENEITQEEYNKLEEILMFLEKDVSKTKKEILKECYSLMSNDNCIEHFEMFMETSMILLFKENDKLYVVPSVIEVNM